MIGKRLGGYVIQAELGKGGMGVVYRAKQIKLNRAVALKLLPPQFTMDQGFIKRFRREAQAIARLNHPNIVQVYDIGEENGTQYYAMELVEGETVDDKLVKSGHLTVRESTAILAGICRGLHVAHEAGIVHRDIKPANIIVAEDGTPKLMDFGIALQQTEERLTTTGGIVGTPEYMSPEQANGRDVTSVSDIYSLGIVFYEMLTGQVPFENEKPMVTLQQQAFEEPTPPRSFVPDIPAPIEQIVLKMLAKDPAKRYADCLDVIRDLRTLSTGAVGEISAAGIASTGARNPFAAVPRRRSHAPAILGGGLVLVAALLIFILVTRDEPAPPPPVATGPAVTVSDREFEQQLVDVVVTQSRAEAARKRFTVHFANGGALFTQEAEAVGEGVRITLPGGDSLVLPSRLLADPPIAATPAPDVALVAGRAHELARAYLLRWKSEHGYDPPTPDAARAAVEAFTQTLPQPEPHPHHELLAQAWKAEYDFARAERAADAAVARVERLRSNAPNTDTRFPDRVVLRTGRRMPCRILDSESTFETLHVALADGGRTRLAFADIRYVDRAYGSAERAAEAAADRVKAHQAQLREARKHAGESAAALDKATRERTAALNALAGAVAPAVPEPAPAPEPPPAPTDGDTEPRTAPAPEDTGTILWNEPMPFGLLPTAGVDVWRAADPCETGVEMRGDGTGGLWLRGANDAGSPGCPPFAVFDGMQLGNIDHLTVEIDIRLANATDGAIVATWIEVEGRGVRPLAYVVYSNVTALTTLPTGITAETPPLDASAGVDESAAVWSTVTLPVADDWLAAGAGDAVEITAIRLVHYQRGSAEEFASGFRDVTAWGGGPAPSAP